MMKKNKIWLGLSGIFTFLFVLMISLTILANNNAMLINDFLGLSTSGITLKGTAYGNEAGELTEEGQARLIEDSYEFCVELQEEGSVLLYNNGALPLKADERDVSLFGRNGADIIYRSTAGGPAPNNEKVIALDKAFTDAEFKINEELFEAYKGSKLSKAYNKVAEEPVRFYDSLKSSFSAYKDVAIVTLARFGTEGEDVGLTSENGARMLALDTNEADMLKMIKAEGFEKTIVLLNSVFPMELDWLMDEQYGVDACLWIGNPGYYGLPGVVNILTGAANPSGHTMETYAANSYSSPAMQNFGKKELQFDSGVTQYEKSDGFVVYKENIYVGYKYYETRYEDALLGVPSASGSAGVFASEGSSWNYADEVTYPFGFGLSYTTFKHSFDNLTYNANKDEFTAYVTVENTGSKDGKSAVQVYAQLPYTKNGIEKSAIQLVAYDKVEVAAGKKEHIYINFDRYLLASYDAYNAKGYIFEPGDYYFALGNGAHEALNNILQKKGVSNLYDHEKESVTGDTGCVQTYNPGLNAVDTDVYKMSPYNDEVQVTNKFDDVDLNYWADTADKVEYLTRSDWGTFPTTKSTMHVNDRIYKGLNTQTYVKKADTPSLSSIETGATLEEKINFLDMKGVAYEDAKWDTFLSQLTLNELCISIGDGRGIRAVGKINKPMNAIAEGPEGLLATFKYGEKLNCTGFPTLPIVSSTWDPAMQTKYGEMFGEEALFSGVPMVNAPGANIIRTPYLGRASEYFSEDAILSANTASNIIKAMREKGLICNIKHFFLNNQETFRQGIATFALEQSIREIYMRSFETAMTKGGCLGIMTSYNRIGLTYAAVNSVIMNDILREEWNFKGSIICDALSESQYSSTPDMLINGTNIFCLDGSRSGKVENLIKSTDDGTLLNALKESNRRIFWTLLQSSLGGLDSNFEVDNSLLWWQTLIIVVDVVVGVLMIGSIALFIVFGYFKKSKEKEAAL